MKTVIEVNGRKYDARTGQILSNDAKTQSSTQPSVRTAPVLDGVNRRKPAATPSVTPPAHKVALKPTQPAPKPTAHPSATKALDIKPSKHKIQKAKTLLRTAVKKPQKTAPVIHSTSTAVESKVERSATGRGLLLRRTPDSRIARARQTAKSAAIQKFGSAKAIVSTPKVSSDLKVAQPPKETVTSNAPAAAPILTKPALGKHAKKQQVFNHPIANANHHEAPKVVKKERLHARIAKKLHVRPQAVAITAGALSVIMLAGFFAYQNVPAVAMRVAANQAGFEGRLPTNPPAGYAFKGPIQYAKGSIAVKYNSNSDDRSFTITQKPTDWTSDSLLANYVSNSKERYQTYHDRGLTVFVYNNGNATWVDNGVWYNLTGQGSLSSDQILAIAGSM
ncbi:MAG: hypothetical protein U0491_02440 [Candidatus Saccharimonadales bacterium]